MACEYCGKKLWFFRATILCDIINELLPVPHNCVKSLEFHAGCLVIIAVRHLKNQNYESCIWQLWEVTSRFFAHVLSQICHQSHVAWPSLLPPLSNLPCTFLQKHLNRLSPNPFSATECLARQLGLESYTQSCNRHFAVHVIISQVFQTILSPNYGPMLPLQNPSHPYILPLSKGTKVGLPNPFGKLRQGQFCLL
jgi:hypothetical protein